MKYKIIMLVLLLVLYSAKQLNKQDVKTEACICYYNNPNK